MAERKTMWDLSKRQNNVPSQNSVNETDGALGTASHQRAQKCNPASFSSRGHETRWHGCELCVGGFSFAFFRNFRGPGVTIPSGISSVGGGIGGSSTPGLIIICRQTVLQSQRSLAPRGGRAGRHLGFRWGRV